MQTLTILGATGSIGKNTLDVVKRHNDKYRVYALTANSDYETLLLQARDVNAQHVVLADVSVQNEALALAASMELDVQCHFGVDALVKVSNDNKVDTVMAAIVGAAGLIPTFAAVAAGKRVLLANKEALVMSGELFIAKANECGATILPIDSEHNAIFQCLPHSFKYGDLAASGISKVLLTGSGGPFLETDLALFDAITPAQACAHPNWDMGQKISIDSATMMNKGLEFIEARWLFGLDNDDIDIVLHPQSTIHSMVQYVDGSVIAQMGAPDMRTPIAHALAYPVRIKSGVNPLDFNQLRDFTFSTPCPERYPNLYLALRAARMGQSACTTLNAANEINVAAFLAGHISFTDIARCNAQVLDAHEISSLTTIEQVIQCDQNAREVAQSAILELS
ncbi:1-deoxy-D-xylulose-5-phosphate reductoisomerase [Glaciecola sp. HTCC2999]|uniref:1-deoxy-D-xylulose-5-phosphate reductoisomerase n=1 Tax=Glaciecola sp. HTCC2999 TaxID=455436 RepID=UPI0000E0E58C|nr:1-deoxy-D-xylulose-5-phosphate reductoisomerase [Glaciecola sp. HTCC2999]